MGQNATKSATKPDSQQPACLATRYRQVPSARMKWLSLWMLVGTLLESSAAHAQAATQISDRVSLIVECETLAAEERAAIEARARMDFQLRQARPGTLRLRCDTDHIVVTFVADSGDQDQVAVQPAPTRAALLDSVLDALVRLTAPLPVEPSSEPAEDEGEERVPEVEQEPEPQETPRPPQDEEPPPLPTPVAGNSILQAHVATEADAWSSSIFGAGAALGLSWNATSRLAVLLRGGLSVGMNVPENFDVLRSFGMLGVRMQFGQQRQWEAGLGAGFTHWIVGRSASVPPRATETLPELWTRAGYHFTLTQFLDLAAGASIAVQQAPTRIDLDDEPQFTFAALRAGIYLEGRVGLIE